MRFYLFLYILIAFGLLSCSEGDRCYESVDTFMVTSFSINGFEPINDMAIRGVDYTGQGDTLVNDTLMTLNKRYALPLSLSEDSTGFVVTANEVTDTFYVRHTMIMKLISDNCGYAPDYTISGFRFSGGIDSIKISDGEVNPKSIEKKANDQNISIYFNSAAH